MNERYGRNDRHESRGRYGARNQDWQDEDWQNHNRHDYDNPRQQQQWHDETRDYGDSINRQRGSGQMSGQHGSYGGASQEFRNHDDDDWSSTESRGRSDFGAQRGGWQGGGMSASGRSGREHQGGYGSQGYGAQGTGMRGRDEYERGGRSSRGSYGSSGYGAAGRSDFSSFTGSDFGGRDFSSGHDAYGSSYSSGIGRNYNRAYGGSGGYDGGVAGRDYMRSRDSNENRGFMARAGDEIASWFGDDEAARRREMDHRGRGPSGYTRSDERIKEDANDALTHDHAVDASNITVSVESGEVTLSGTVTSRFAKRRAEDCVDNVSGVRHVQNNLRVQDAMSGNRSAMSQAGATTGTAATGSASATPSSATGSSTTKSGSSSTPR